MALGQNFSNGGKAIESNILDSQIKYVKTFSEYLLSVGQEKVVYAGLTNTVQPTTTLYTVPNNVTAFIFNMNHSIYSGTTDPQISTVFVDDAGGLAYISRLLIEGELSGTHDSANIAIPFIPPLKLNPNQTLILTKNPLLLVGCTCSIRLVEVPKEISIN